MPKEPNPNRRLFEEDEEDEDDVFTEEARGKFKPGGNVSEYDNEELIIDDIDDDVPPPKVSGPKKPPQVQPSKPPPPPPPFGGFYEPFLDDRIIDAFEAYSALEDIIYRWFLENNIDVEDVEI